jgi:hypothetical protein
MMKRRIPGLAPLLVLLLIATVACGNDEVAQGAISDNNGHTIGNDQDSPQDQPDPAAPANSDDTEAPDPDPEPAPEAPAVPQAEADYIAFEGGLRVYPQDRRIELDCLLLTDQTRPLEFLLVSPGGATHESLFASPARAEHLKRGLEIIGLQEAEVKRHGRGHQQRPLGDRVQISVRFAHHQTGEVKVVPVEKWLWDNRINSHPEPGGWVFTGSHERYDPDVNRSVFDADLRGNHIALWRDASCVIDNDRPSGGVPDVYAPFMQADGIPRPDGPTRNYPEVTVIFEPYIEPEDAEDSPETDAETETEEETDEENAD